MKQHFVLKKGALAICIALATMQQAVADDIEKGPAVEKIIITGSNIKRVDAEGPASVVVISRQQIERSGAASVVELLDHLPGTTGTDWGTTNSFAMGGASASLRGLGAKNVLILLNGRRIANYGYAIGTDSTFVDLHEIPLNALDRVEILRDGASAIYGSDAVAGVINFITRRNYTGSEAFARTGINSAGDGSETTAGFTIGMGDLALQNQNLLLSFDVYHAEPGHNSKHPYTRSSDLRPYGGSDLRATGYNPGSFIRQSSTKWEPMPGCDPAHIVVDDRTNLGSYCRTETADYTQFSPRTDRAGVAAIFNRELNANLAVFGEVGLRTSLLHLREGYPGIANYQANRYLVPGDPAYRQTLNGVPLNGDSINFQRNVYEGGESESTNRSNSLRLIAGVRGSIDQWDYESAVGYSQNKLNSVHHKYLLADGITEALRQGGYDPFKMRNEPSAVNALFTDVGRRATSRLESWDAKLTNEKLFALPGGNVGFASGVSVIHEYMQDRSDQAVYDGKIENWAATGSKGGRTVKSIYAELNIPVLKNLEMQAALRHDRYSDFGGTSNPKLALAYRPFDTVLLRGSATTAFKAPTLPQLYMGPTKAYSAGVADWVRCVPIGLGPDRCHYYPEESLISNPNLKPEKSKIVSGGVVFEPFKQTSISLDYYRIRQSDTIQLIDDQYVLDHEFTDPEMAKLIIRNPRNPVNEAKWPGLKDGRLKSITLPFMNIGTVDTSGVDLEMHREFTLPRFGKLILDNKYNVILSFERTDMPGTQAQDRVGGKSYPKWRNSFSIAWAKDAWRTDLTARTVAGSLDVGEPWKRTAATVMLPSHTTADVNITYTGIKKLTINAGVQNVLDAKPRFSTESNGFLDNVTGRFFYGNIRYAFN